MKFNQSIFVFILLMLPQIAHADYYKLYAPKVEKGETSIEANINYSVDDVEDQNSYLSQVYGIEYGVTNYWMTEVAVELEKNNAEAIKLTNLKFENILAPWKPGQNWIDAAFYFEIEKGTRSDSSNNAEIKLLLEKDLGKFKNIANIGLNHQFGANSTAGYNGAIALHSTYDINQFFQPGIEYYGDYGNINEQQNFNNQSHLVGPVFYGRSDRIKYDIGALFGISNNAPDATIKLNAEYEF